MIEEYNTKRIHDAFQVRWEHLLDQVEYSKYRSEVLTSILCK